MMNFEQMGFLSILVATVAAFLLGGVWFGAIFKKQYAIALGRDKDENFNPMPNALFFVGPIVCSFIIVLTHSLLQGSLSLGSYGDVVIYGVIVGVGYIGATVLNISINPNIPKPLMYTAVNCGYFVLTSIITNLIIFAL